MLGTGRRPRTRLVGTALAVVSLAAVAACTSSSTGSSAQTAYKSTTGGSTITTYPPGSRQTAPTLSGTTLTGGTLSTASLRGKVVVVNLWGSWCGPCRDEAQGLEAAYTATKAQGVAFVGIDTRDTDASARTFIASKHVTYPSLVDTNGTLALRYAQIVPATSFPSTLILDRQGRVAMRDINEITYTQLMSALTGVLKGS
jgi:peroxiredoxin